MKCFTFGQVRAFIGPRIYPSFSKGKDIVLKIMQVVKNSKQK